MLTLALATILAQLTPIPLSDGGPLGLDDLRVAPDGRFVIPEAELGDVRLSALTAGRPPVDTHLAVGHAGPHRSGAAAGADALIAAGEGQPRFLGVATLAGGEAPAATPLPAAPDYVRLFGDEAWVTEPGLKQIEVYAVARKPLGLKRVAALPVPGNPEALELEAKTGVVYTFGEDNGHLYGFDLQKHVKVSEWTLACPGAPKGLALSGTGLAFVGCGGGAALTVSLKDGHEVSRLATGDGVDIIAFDRERRRLYVPSAKAATLTIAQVGADGKLTKLRALPTAPRAHCAVVHAGVVLVCDPTHGQLLRLDDP